MSKKKECLTLLLKSMELVKLKKKKRRLKLLSKKM